MIFDVHGRQECCLSTKIDFRNCLTIMKAILLDFSYVFDWARNDLMLKLRWLNRTLLLYLSLHM